MVVGVVVVELGALRVGRRSAKAGDEGGGGRALLVLVHGVGGGRRRREGRPEGGAGQRTRRRKRMRSGFATTTARRKHERGRAQAGHGSVGSCCWQVRRAVAVVVALRVHLEEILDEHSSVLLGQVVIITTRAWRLSAVWWRMEGRRVYMEPDLFRESTGTV